MPVKTMVIDGLSVRVSGEAGDPYFDSLDLHVGNNDFLLSALRTLPSDAVVFDIGANIGLTSTLAAQRAQSVYAFEPNPATFAYLNQTVEANGLSDVVTPVNLALGEREGDLFFFSDRNSSSASHLITDATLARASTTTVPVTTVDAFVETHGVKRLDFIKIDIEGFEIDALRGASATLARLQPTVLVEFNAFTMIGFRNINPRELLALIRSTFPYVYRWVGEPRPITNDSDALMFIHDNLVSAGCVDDLYASYEPWHPA